MFLKLVKNQTGKPKNAALRWIHMGRPNPEHSCENVRLFAATHGKIGNPSPSSTLLSFGL